MAERLTGDYRRDLDKPYLGHWDIPEGQDLTLTIDHAEKADVKSQRGTEKKTILVFREDVKPMILNVVNRKSIAKALGSPKYEDWEGRRISLFEGNEPKADDGKAIRVRDYPPRDPEYLCADCGRKITGSGKYTAQKIANTAMIKFGRYLCMECVEALKEAPDAE